MPTLALLAFFIAFIGVGFINVMLVLTLLAIPPILTNTYVAVRQVERDTVDAARGHGVDRAEIIRQVELPLSLPTIFAGIRVAAVERRGHRDDRAARERGLARHADHRPATYGDAGQLGAAIVVSVLTLARSPPALAASQRAVTPKG